MVDATRSFLERYGSAEGMAEAAVPSVFDGGYGAASSHSTALVAVPGRTGRQHRVDGAKALQLVEKAAELIRDYEQRFLVIEADARSFVRRVDQERSALNARIEALQIRLAESEAQVRATENALQKSIGEALEARRVSQTLQGRLEDAVAEIVHSSAYFHSIQERLSGL